MATPAQQSPPAAVPPMLVMKWTVTLYNTLASLVQHILKQNVLIIGEDMNA